MVLPCNPGGIRPFPDSLDMFFGILGAMYMNNGQLTPLAAGRSIGFRNGPSSPWQKCNFLNWDSRVSAKTEQR